jgi:hypothetical protein
MKKKKVKKKERIKSRFEEVVIETKKKKSWAILFSIL